MNTTLKNSALLHTPEGVRDIYNEECARKLKVQEVIHMVFSSYGYHDIQTPTFEFFDIFNKERGSVASKNMYKFFDREGNTLVLRPDMTPSIARCVSKYYMDETMPIRLCYSGNTYINNSELQGKLKESTVMGAELIGDTTSDADAEVIAMVIDCLKKTGLQEFQVEVGQVEFFKGLTEEAKMDPETEQELIALISNKNYFGVEELLSTIQMADELKTLFLKLPELFGSIEVVETAKSLTKNARALKAIERLEKLYKILEFYELQDYVSFDLGMLSFYEYYTGIIFKAYTYGTGDEIVTGGRYNNLLRQFGKNAPSVGFGIHVDRMLLAMSRQKIEITTNYQNTMILYKRNHQAHAIALAKHFREKRSESQTITNIELIRKSSKKDAEEYKKFAIRHHMKGIIYIESTSHVRVINLENNSEEVIPLEVILNGIEEKVI